MRLHHLATSLIVALVSAACHNEPMAPAARAVLVTDQGSYGATPVGVGAGSYFSVTVVTHYANEGASAIYLGRCGAAVQPSVGVQAIDADGVPVGSTSNIASACAGASPLVVQSGDVRTDTLTLAIPSTLPARVRLYYLASSCGQVAGICPALLPESDRTSNIVQVVAAP
jgi:hypothetical protein